MERVGSIYKANFDYESVLFNENSEDKVNKIFEHLFFLCCDKEDILFTNKKYEDDYLEYIKTATGFKNKISSKGEAINWWGSLQNLRVEREINSKLTSLEIANNLKTNASLAYEVKSIEAIKEHLLDIGEVIIRSPFERSGRNNLILENLEDFERSSKQIQNQFKSGSLLLEKFHRNRDFDLGTTFLEREKEFKINFQVKNLNDSKGVFRGGLLLKEKVDSPFLDIIAKEYYKRGARTHLQVDSFKFGDHWNWLCEVNYRKTMGHIIKKLSRLCPPSYETALLVTPNSWLKKTASFKVQNELLEEVDGVFLLSPSDSPIKFWLISAVSLEEMNDQLLKWWDIIAKEKRDFPSVFRKIIED